MTIGRKLLMAFLVMAVLSSLATTVLGNLATRSVFDWYVGRATLARAEQWQALFARHYAQEGSWSDIERLVPPTAAPRGRGFARRWQGVVQPIDRGERVILADETGRVIVDSQGTSTGCTLDTQAYRLALPITVDGKQVGTLAVETPLQRGLVTLETEFLRRVTESNIIGGILASLIGVGMAFAFSRRISAPLGELSMAARRLAGGNFGADVEVRADDEIGELARAFNLMKDSLKASDEARHKLMADVAHELRTPLAVLRGSLESMQEGITQPTQEMVISLHDEVIRLSRIVQDLLSLGQMESGGFPLHLQPTRIGEVIAKVALVFAAETDARGIRLEATAEPDLPEVQADPDRIAQVLVNLLANAVLHTPDGGHIAVSARLEGSHVSVSVQDSGPGISQEDLPHVFDRFYRTDAARDRATGGAGLGLAIAKGIIHAHGGTIRVTSEPDRGATFTLVLPIFPAK